MNTGHNGAVVLGMNETESQPRTLAETLMNDIKVGDVVAWKDVPDGAMVRMARPLGWPGRDFYLRCGNTVLYFMGDPTAREEVRARVYDAPWNWLQDGHRGETCTIVALGLTGEESARDLRRLAEIFEVREALGDLDSFEMPADLAHALEEQAEDDEGGARNALACILHAAGWRPGMTAEDAARLLKEGRRAARAG